MRLASALALAATLAQPALAQTQYADSSGAYVSLNEVAFAGNRFESVDGTAGIRFANGVDLGLRVGRGTVFGTDQLRGGPVVGVTRSVGAGWTGRVEGAALYATSGGYAQPYIGPYGTDLGSFSYRFRTVTADLTATVSRRIPLVGSLALRPAIGVFAVGRRVVTYDYPDTAAVPATTDAAIGTHIEVPLTFRLFGQDAAWVVTGRLPHAGNAFLNIGAPTSYGSGGLRLNF